MISKKEYKEAKDIVAKYERQEFLIQNSVPVYVKLSEFGKKMQRPHDKRGLIINKTKAGMSDHVISVEWEDGKIESMHESQTVIVD